MVNSDRSDMSDRSDTSGKLRKTVPSSHAERMKLRGRARSFAARRALVPPVPLHELKALAAELLAEAKMDRRCRDFALVVLNNEIWRNEVAAVPYARRTLVLPPCLRASKACKARFDELGLLCERCGSCPICSLQAEAERLGYSVLVAEGTGVVSNLIRRGMIDAVIGVSCMESLEAAFPHMTASAVPGIAIPLLMNGCQDTRADVDWILDELRATSSRPAKPRLDLDALHATVDAWFAPAAIRTLLGARGLVTEDIALGWLTKAGKRWRPFLTACACHALRPDAAPEALRPVAVAVECFHKASLVHDDIEDNDSTRYGEETLHRRHGVPLALNAGDLLIGEGYRLIAACAAPPAERAAMLAIAAEGHHALCIGQGEELAWMRAPSPLSCEQVLDIFRLKTAPAFGVALRLGAVCGGARDSLHDILRRYSDALGVAYQIKDDLADFLGGTDDLRTVRPSLLCAIAHESAGAQVRKLLHTLWRSGALTARDARRLRRLMTEAGIEARAREMLEACTASALDALKPLDHAALKSLLFLLLAKLLDGGQAGT